MKNSNKLLLMTLFALTLGVISYAFYLEPYMALTKREVWPGNNPLVPEDSNLEMGMIEDSLRGAFHYLWTNFPNVQLDPRTDNLIKKFETRAGWEGYTFGRVEFLIERDTLFIRHNNGLMTTTTPDDTTRVLHSVMVAARQLRGIEVVGKGSVRNLTKLKILRSQSPTDSKLPRDLQHRFEAISGDELKRVLRYPKMQEVPSDANTPGVLWHVPQIMENERLHLSLRQGGKVDLDFQGAGHISVSVIDRVGVNNYTEIKMAGSCKLLEIDHQNAHLNIKAYPLEAETVKIQSKGNQIGTDATIRVWANRYLQARIDGWANVLYLGAPQVDKWESHAGRVVNANRYQ